MGFFFCFIHIFYNFIPPQNHIKSTERLCSAVANTVEQRRGETTRLALAASQGEREDCLP